MACFCSHTESRSEKIKVIIMGLEYKRNIVEGYSVGGGGEIERA
jgi:hypothetical protein